MQIGINFRAVCLCLSCEGCRLWTHEGLMIAPHCELACADLPECMPMGACPGYKKKEVVQK